MPTPRSVIVDESQPGVYHCLSRCVRRAYLCGDGYDHRRAWLERQIAKLVNLMAIDVFAYSILSNHFHILLAIRPDIVADWPDDEVARRYLHICPCRWKRRLMGIPVDADPTDVEIASLTSNSRRLANARVRLSSLSWFMAKLKEPIARRANHEDDCKGRCWEGRRRSCGVLDEAAIVAVAAYVDLNPLRAGVVGRPEDATHTSIPNRIKLLRDPSAALPVPLADLPSCSLRQYLQFVDQSARALIPGKQSLDPTTLPILERIGLSSPAWGRLLKTAWDSLKGTAIGMRTSLEQEALRRGGHWVCSPLHAPDR